MVERETDADNFEPNLLSLCSYKNGGGGGETKQFLGGGSGIAAERGP